MKKIAVINGPNLDRLGKREPEVYGKTTLAELVLSIRERAAKHGFEVFDFQSNSEADIITKIAELADAGVKFAIINPGGLTHTSVALRDSIAGSGMEFIEVHISNIFRREEFRHKSYTAGVCTASIAGLGLEGYFAALEYFAKK